MRYILAGVLILLGTGSGLIFVITIVLREFKAESALSKRIPRWGKELLLCLSGQLVAVSIICLGKLQFAPTLMVYAAWAVLCACLVKFCFLLPDLTPRKGPDE